jgi:alkylation response protein AidB-like acyl-CoA dehydrogenase
VKLFESKLQVELTRSTPAIVGPYAQLAPGEPLAPLNGQISEGYQFTPVMTIGGGSSEIQRNIVAQRTGPPAKVTEWS